MRLSAKRKANPEGEAQDGPSNPDRTPRSGLSPGRDNLISGEVPEWLNGLAWKVSVRC